MTQSYYNSQQLKNSMMMTCAAAAATAQGNGRLDSYTIDENDFNEENCIEGMASEFNEESA